MPGAMRIALLTRRFDSAGGGTERDLIVTAQGLRAAGHQVTIFADEIRGETGGWEVRRVGAGPRLDARCPCCDSRGLPRPRRAARAPTWC